MPPSYSGIARECGSSSEFRRLLKGDGSTTKERLDHLMFTADWLCDHVPIGQGTNKVSDCLGNASTAVPLRCGSGQVWMLLKGSPPSDKNGDALTMCVGLWEFAGQPVSLAASKGEVDCEASWERHIRTVRQASANNRLSDPALGAWMSLQALFIHSGLIPTS